MTEDRATRQLEPESVPALPSRGSLLAPSRDVVLRLAVHLAVWAPFVVGVVEDVRLRWRPVGDGAAIAVRSWDSLTAYGPLVGQASRLAYEVYDPGPLEYWLLAIPVHVDPRYGELWGAALWCMIAASLAIEAARSALGGLGGFIGAAVILGILAWYPGIALHPFWNPWFGVMFFLAVLAASWAALSGNRRWWVVLVVAGSVASQAHLMFALPSVALVVLTLAVGLVDSLRTKSGYRWVLAGLIIGAGCWVAPFIQQVTGRRGNLAFLLKGQGTGPVSGAAFGLKTLTASIRPPPLWWPASNRLHQLPALQRIADRPAGFAVAALIVIAAVLVVAVRPLRSRRLAALAAISLLVSLAALVTYSRIPAGNTGLSALNYLDVITFPVGVLAWLVVGSAVVLAGRRLISRRPAWAAAPGTPSAAPRAGWAARIAILAAVALIAWWSVRAVAQSEPARAAPLAAMVSPASQRVEHALPPQQIALFISEQRSLVSVLGLVWTLRADGYRPLVSHRDARELGSAYVFSDQPVPQVTLYVRGDRVRVRVVRPGPRYRMPRASAGVGT